MVLITWSLNLFMFSENRNFNHVSEKIIVFSTEFLHTAMLPRVAGSTGIRGVLATELHTLFAQWTWWSTFQTNKKCRIRSFSGPYFQAFGLNTQRYSLSQNTRKCGPEKLQIRTLFVQCMSECYLLKHCICVSAESKFLRYFVFEPA